ncbi:signal peptidase I [Streptomyces sp. NPDC051555]|uniref:signal peptidase I n=1 Tax=Streptomyces sp. NPDC051555 TaxID=3365657 RepID=UPI0037B95125
MLRRLYQWAINGLVGALVFTVAGAAAAQLAGAAFLPVLTGSMHPTIPQGALVVVTGAKPSDLHVGDVAVFQPPPGWTLPGAIPVVHRVHSFEDRAGMRLLRTKGDANKDLDPWKINLATGEFQRVVFSVPYLGSVINSSRGVIGYGAVLAGLGFVLTAIVRAFRGVGRHRNRQGTKGGKHAPQKELASLRAQEFPPQNTTAAPEFRHGGPGTGGLPRGGGSRNGRACRVRGRGAPSRGLGDQAVDVARTESG